MKVFLVEGRRFFNTRMQNCKKRLKVPVFGESTSRTIKVAEKRDIKIYC